MNLISLSIIPSSPPLLKPYLLHSTLHSPKLATANGGARRNFRSPVVAKASAVSGYAPEIGQILGDVPIFTAAGDSVLFKDLWDQKELPFPMDCLYADPDRKAYDLLGLYYGFGRTFFNPASAKVLSKSRFDALREAVKNYSIDATPDDRSGVLQQGGTFVFKGKQLLYARKDEGTGDHAPLDDIYNICC